MVVYLDLIFLMNFAIDGCLLLLTAWFRKRKVVIWRLLLSAGVGASYVVMMFMPALSFLFTFLVKFLFSVVMLWIAFGFVSLQNYIRNLGAFYIVNFVAAGGILGIYYLLQSSGELWNGIWYTATGGMGFSLEIGTLFTLVVFTLVLLWFRMVVAGRRRQENLSSYYAEVLIELGQIKIACTGLIDTGNQLQDPLSRLPVMVTEMSLWQPYMPQSFGQTAQNGGLSADNLILQWTEDEAFPWRDRLRLIPYRGVNRGSQFMLALKPDKVTVTMENKSYVTTRVLVGLDGGTLSSEGSYRAIIHPALMEEHEQQAGIGIGEDTRSCV
ncbi:sigma-E processing peptidase SpoIIGA [Paenibacillus brevis]|uniref:Sigma-E processing peptidase SpoIIGA n=1 Tax=Paenibacillus brevis TaxID=2841508 RepID=A0ABS6FW63_9BACL|nr:sigma-E processing peptidase SpoIIGA [Paenibacillus brevis]MBU5674470.1 sigma-E processing peptidase SpoIIGA [Paenibacillus brevis]